MLRIALAEDSPADEARMRGLVGRFADERGLRAELLCFADGDELLADHLIDVDMFLLDIEMPGSDGFRCARLIRKADRDVPICFVTNLGHLAPEGYAVDAMGFLVKPVSYESLKRVICRAMERTEYRRTRLVPLRDGKGERFVDLHGIRFLEARNKHTVVHVDGGELACSESLKAVEARLAKTPGAEFARIHSAYLVNLEHVEGATAAEVVVDGERLPVSRHRKQGLMAALASFIGRQL